MRTNDNVVVTEDMKMDTTIELSAPSSTADETDWGGESTAAPGASGSSAVLVAPEPAASPVDAESLVKGEVVYSKGRLSGTFLVFIHDGGRSHVCFSDKTTRYFTKPHSGRLDLVNYGQLIKESYYYVHPTSSARDALETAAREVIAEWVRRHPHCWQAADLIDATRAATRAITGYQEALEVLKAAEEEQKRALRVHLILTGQLAALGIRHEAA